MPSNEVQEAVDKAVADNTAEMRNICYDVGRTLQKENQDHFHTMFKHVLNVDPASTAEVKQFQAVQRHSETHMETSAQNGRTIRKLVITAGFGWAIGILSIAWAWAKNGSN